MKALAAHKRHVRVDYFNYGHDQWQQHHSSLDTKLSCKLPGHVQAADQAANSIDVQNHV